MKSQEQLVAIPFLQVTVAAGKAQRSSSYRPNQKRTDPIIAAPRLLCPNPARTVCMRVKGNSMAPTLFDGYIVVVDEAQTDAKKLNGKMIVVHHDEFGLVVTRFWHLDDLTVLVSDNRSYEPVPWTSSWRIVGKVLWSIGEPASDPSDSSELPQ